MQKKYKDVEEDFKEEEEPTYYTSIVRMGDSVVAKISGVIAERHDLGEGDPILIKIPSKKHKEFYDMLKREKRKLKINKEETENITGVLSENGIKGTFKLHPTYYRNLFWNTNNTFSLNLRKKNGEDFEINLVLGDSGRRIKAMVKYGINAQINLSGYPRIFANKSLRGWFEEEKIEEEDYLEIEEVSPKTYRLSKVKRSG